MEYRALYSSVSLPFVVVSILLLLNIVAALEAPVQYYCHNLLLLHDDDGSAQTIR